MTTNAPSLSPGMQSVGVANDSASLNTFLNPARSAAIWQRTTPPDVQCWLNELDPAVLPKGRVILPPSSVAQTVCHLCDMAGTPNGDKRDWLEAEIAYLSATFAELMSADFLRLRLDVVTTNACRKFHIDALTARLVCTYRGTGTQFGRSTDGNDPEVIHTVRTGAPILLRGTEWPSHPASDLVHRSPPIEGSGETRLVLVLDPVQEQSDGPKNFNKTIH